VVALLAQPVVAALLGTALGVGLLLASRASFRAFTPDAPEAGLVYAAISLFVRMAIAAGLLFVYYRFISEGFLPFAIGVAGGFLVMYTIELVRYGKVLARPR
jgi:enoyl-CoA hydratase/carnithine racemase